MRAQLLQAQQKRRTPRTDAATGHVALAKRSTRLSAFTIHQQPGTTADARATARNATARQLAPPPPTAPRTRSLASLPREEKRRATRGVGGHTIAAMGSGNAGLGYGGEHVSVPRQPGASMSLRWTHVAGEMSTLERRSWGVTAGMPWPRHGVPSDRGCGPPAERAFIHAAAAALPRARVSLRSGRLDSPPRKQANSEQ